MTRRLSAITLGEVSATTALEHELAALLGADRVLPADAPGYGADDSEAAGVAGRPDAVVLPRIDG